MASKRKLTGFTLRVRTLVAKYFDRNVTKAAREMGVRQRALQKIYTGVTDDPRLSMIQAIFKSFPTEDPRWIVLGQSSEDENRFDRAVEERAQQIAFGLLREIERRNQSARKRKKPQRAGFFELETEPAPSEPELFPTRSSSKRK